MYLIPWIDVIAIGREVYHQFPNSIVLFLFPGTPHAYPAYQAHVAYFVAILADKAEVSSASDMSMCLQGHLLAFITAANLLLWLCSSCYSCPLSKTPSCIISCASMPCRLVLMPPHAIAHRALYCQFVASQFQSVCQHQGVIDVPLLGIHLSLQSGLISVCLSTIPGDIWLSCLLHGHCASIYIIQNS